MTVNPVGAGGLAAPGIGKSEGDGERFAASLTQFLKDVNNDQLDAAKEIKRLVVDGEGSIHEAMVAMSKAEASFRLLMEMRNRVVDGVNRLLQTMS